MAMSRKAMTVRGQRRTAHDKLRRIANQTVGLLTLIISTERRLSFPHTPFEGELGAIEEYYNQLADEFDDEPGKPPMQSYDDAMITVRALHAAEVAGLGAAGARLEQLVGTPTTRRNVGGNADSAGDLLGDAIGILLDAAGNVSGMPVSKSITEAIGVLRQLEVAAEPAGTPTLAERADMRAEVRQATAGTDPGQIGDAGDPISVLKDAIAAAKATEGTDLAMLLELVLDSLETIKALLKEGNAKEALEEFSE